MSGVTFHFNNVYESFLSRPFQFGEKIKILTLTHKLQSTTLRLTRSPLMRIASSDLSRARASQNSAKRSSLCKKNKNRFLLRNYLVFGQNIIVFLLQGSGLTGLFTSQFNTQDYGTFTDVVKSIGEPTSCSSHIIFILVPNVFLCCCERPPLSCWRPFHSDRTNTY